MLCQECKKNPATVHITTIINNKKNQLHLCESCAGKREDINMFSPFSISNLLTSFLEPMKSTVSVDSGILVKCEKCGMDYQQFKKTGRLGCENCYKTFKNEVYPIVRRIQGGASSHAGKRPAGHNARLHANKEIEDLKRQLEGAINIEAFEEAAILRDKIKDLEKRQEQEG